MAAGAGSVRGPLGPARRLPRARPDARGVDQAPPRRQGGRPRALPPRAARDPKRSRRAIRGNGSSRPPTSAWSRAMQTPPFRTTPGGCPSTRLKPTAFDHGEIVRSGLARLRAKLSYTNVGFALAPDEFTLSAAARALRRRARPRRLGDEPPPGAGPARSPRADRRAPRTGTNGRPPGVAVPLPSTTLEVTDPFAVLRPPRSP